MLRTNLLVILIVSWMLFGLKSTAQQFNGGVMAGLASSQVAGDTYTGFKQPGLFFGGFVNLNVSLRSSFQMELEFFQKGSKKNPEPEKNDYDDYHFRANYVELPILYQFTFVDWFKMEIGPSAGFLISANEDMNGEKISENYDWNKPAGVTLQINVGMYVDLFNNFSLNFRTNNSLFNIRSQKRTGDVRRFWGYGQYHDSLVLSLFYTFRKKGE